MNNQLNQTTKIAIFKGTKVRKTIHSNEWWFSIIDVVQALAGTDRPRKYWNDLKKKLEKEGFSEVSEKIGQLKMIAPVNHNLILLYFLISLHSHTTSGAVYPI